MSCAVSAPVLGVLLASIPGGTRPNGEVATATPSSPHPVATLAPASPVYHWQDFDRDGAQDVYVQGPDSDHLFHNVGGRFEDVTQHFGLAHQQGTQWVAWIDLDADQLPDLTLIDAAGAIRVLRNAATEFVDATEGAGLPMEPLSLAEWSDID